MNAPTWPLCLNTSTIRPASLPEKIAIAAEAGYTAVELWSDDLTQLEKQGRPLSEVKQRLRDAGLKVPSVIALFDWMQSEGADKEAAFGEARRRMEQAPEQIEFVGGIFASDVERCSVLGMLLENLGIDKAVQFGRLEDWKAAIEDLERKNGAKNQS